VTLITRDQLLEQRRWIYKSASAALREEATRSASYIFLSHSTKDAEQIIALRDLIEEQGFSVYVDWLDDPGLDRNSVSATTARHLRKRIASSRGLLVHATDNARVSRWVPWELGIADGLGKKVAMLPVLTKVSTSHTSTSQGSEYLGLYPWIDLETASESGVLPLGESP
jgi:hypothetical protein